MEIGHQNRKEATERHAEVATPAVRRVDTAVIEAEAARIARIRVGATRPIVGSLAGAVQGAIIVDIPATYKDMLAENRDGFTFRSRRGETGIDYDSLRRCSPPSKGASRSPSKDLGRIGA